MMSAIPTSASSDASLPLFDFWLWLERASWVAAILSLVGIAAAIVGVVVAWRIGRAQIQLFASEQHRIAEELSRRAELTVGYQMPNDSLIQLTTLHPIWAEDRNLSDPVTIWIVIRNVGTRTAYDVDINFVFPAGFRTAEAHDLVPDGRLRISRIENFVNPATNSNWRFPIQIPKDVTQFQIRITLTARDTGLAEHNLGALVQA